jgi:urease accessory protein
VGATGARITAADFLTPPEFAGLSLATRPAGQVGGVRLALRAHDGRTSLGPCYQQVPLRVLPPFTLPDEPALLYLLNPTAGLLDGDAHLVHLDAGPGTRAVVTGQSATRIHPAVAGFATQQWHLRVGEDARVVVLPGPTIPFAGCRYFQLAEIDLTPDARLIWGDVWLPGRYGREPAESWVFEKLVQQVEVRRAGGLVHRERFCWRGPWGDEERSWHLGPASAAGTLFVTGDSADALPAPEEGVVQAVLATAAGDRCVRWCGSPPAVIRAVVRAALTLAGAWDGATAWLGSSHLAGNHWFSTCRL